MHKMGLMTPTRGERQARLRCFDAVASGGSEAVACWSPPTSNCQGSLVAAQLVFLRSCASVAIRSRSAANFRFRYLIYPTAGNPKRANSKHFRRWLSNAEAQHLLAAV